VGARWRWRKGGGGGCGGGERAEPLFFSFLLGGCSMTCGPGREARLAGPACRWLGAAEVGSTKFTRRFWNFSRADDVRWHGTSRSLARGSSSQPVTLLSLPHGS
jgi:hypothetical protein